MRSSSPRSVSLSVVFALACMLFSASASAQAAPPAHAYPPAVYPAQPYQQPYPPPVYAPAPPPPGYSQQIYVTQPRPYAPRPRRGLLIAGISTLAASYAVGLVTGAILIDTRCCENAGWSLFIPLAGPFMATARVDNARGALAMLGVVQVVGAGLTIGGAVQFALSLKQNAKASQALRFELREGRSLALDLSTSPMLTGPTMKMRF
jgi:hypothetical protein